MKDSIVHIFSGGSVTLINDLKGIINRLCIVVSLLFVFITPLLVQAQHLDNRKRLDSFQRARTATSATILKVLANSYNVTGGGPYCAGGSGVVVGLSGSEQDTTYQLQRDGVDIGSSVTGTGAAISFGLQTAAGNYTVYANTVNGPIAMNGSVNIVINPLPTVTADPKQVCFGNNSVALTGTPTGGTWSGTGVSGSTFNANGLAAGNYTVTYSYTDANSCTNSATATVTVNALPTVTADPKQICFGNNSVALTGAPAGGTWSGTGVSGSNFNANGLAAGNYTVTYSYTDANSCTNTATTTVTVNAFPTVTANPKQVCFGNNSVALTGAPAGGTWSGTGVSGSNFNANGLAAGNYTVTYSYTDANSCTNTATATVTVNALPTVTANPKQVCFGNNSVALTGAPAGGTWSGTGVSGSNFNANGLAAGNYTVTYSYTDANSCTNTATATVTVNALPTVTADLKQVCFGNNSVALTGAPAGGTWSGTGVSGSSFNANGLSAGNYTVTYSYTDANSCTNSATTTVTVNALPIVTANPKQVCFGNNSVALTGAPAGGTWSGTGVSGSNFNANGLAAGNYTVTYSYTDANSCTNTATATVTVNALPTVTANPKQVCFGNNSVALTGAPAGGTWSGTGVSGSTFNANGLAAGNYTVTYTYTDANSCTNTATATVTVNALPTVTADPKQVCFGNNSVALTGTPAGGTWSGTGVSGSNFNANGLAAGNYTVTYSYTDANSCTNTATATVTVNALPIVTANPKQVCFGNNSVALTGTPAGGTWSGTGVSGSTFNANGLATGNYTVTYSYTDANSCTNTATATVTVNALPTVTCPANSTVCISASPFALSGATPAGGTYSGTGVSGGNFNPATAGVGQQTITYTYSDGNGCTNNCTFNITVIAATTTANAGPDQTGAATCGTTTVTLAANTPTTGTGSWSIISGAGGTITTLSDPASTFTGTAGTTYTLRWTITNAPCASSTDDVVITFNRNPTTANAGSDQTLCATTATLAGNAATVGTGTWTLISGAGTITTPGSPTSGITGLGVGANTFRWTISNAPCTASFDEIVITRVAATTVAAAGPDQTGAATCGTTTVTLAANAPTVGTGSWSIVSGAGGTITTPSSPTSTFTGTAGTSYTLRWTITNPPCASTTDDVIITFNQNPTTANAGPDQTGAATCGTTSVTLAANVPTAGTGSWSIVSGAGGTITTPSSSTSTFTGTAGTTYTLRWTITSSPCTSSTDDVIITFNRNPTTANAGSDQTLCATTATLAGNAATVGTGAWTLISGTGTITTPNSPTSGITGLGVGANTFRWTISNAPCTATFDEVVITRVAATTVAAAGPDQTGAATCGTTSVTLAANVPTAGTGSWSIISGAGGSITTLSDPSSTFTGTAGTTYTLRWTITNAPCASSTDDVIITFNRNPTTANAGSDQTLCATTATLAGNAATVGTGTWTLISGAGTITTPGSPTSGITGLGVGANTFRWTISNAPCTATVDDVVITRVATTTIAAAGPDQTGATTCGLTSVTLAANVPTAGTGSWSIVSGTGGTITAPSSATSTFTGTAGATYTLRWTITNPPCASTTDDVIITFNQNPTTANAGTAQSVCVGGNVTLAANTPTVGTGVWSIVSGPSTSTAQFSSTTNTAATFTPAGGAGSYVLRWTISNAPCTASTSNVTITVNALPAIPTISAGGPTTFCQGGSVTLTSSAATGNQWSLNGTAISGATNQTYSATTGGSYTVTVTNGNGCSRTSTGTSITVNPVPTISVSPAIPAAFCSGGSVTLTASGGNTYTWSPATGLSITTGATVIATPDATTTYTVTGTGANGCTSTATVTVSVTPTPDGEITSSPPVCSGNNSGTIILSNYTGTIVRWESSTNGGSSWTTINNTSTTQSYSNLTQTTIYRVLLTLNNGCDGYSDVGIIPVNEPFTPTVTVNPASICLGQSATLKASDYGPPPFPTEDFQNANPAGWSGNDANNNNKGDNSEWGETGNGKTFNGLLWNSNAPPTNSKYMIVNGTGGGSIVSLITPPFSLVGLTNPIFNYYTAMNLNVGSTAWVEISTDGGASYNTLKTYTGPTNVGNPNNGFIQESINLSAYIGQPNVKIRFRYSGTTGSNWGIDNVGLGGTYQPVTYQWSPLTYLTPANGVGQTVTTTPTASGTFNYCVVATTAAGCSSSPVCADVLVKPLPVCSISGTDSVCPASTNTYSAPAGLTYSWSITGKGTISGSSTGQTVSVLAARTCGTYTLNLTTTLNACTSTCSRTFTIYDTTRPVITITAAGTVGCNPAAAAILAAFGTASVTDNCTTGLTATFSDGAEQGTGCIRTVTRTWSVTDSCGNSATASQTVSFTRDTQGPTFVGVPANATVQCDGIPSAPAVTANDNCSPSVAVTYGEVVNVVEGCGTITRTWASTDLCGNTSTATQTLTVVDTTRPVLIGVPANETVQCTNTIIAGPSVTATDNCDPTITVNFTETNNVVQGCGTITRTWTATDNCGNTATATQIVTVIDNTAPVAVSPATQNFQCLTDVPAPGTLTATDNCSGNITATGVDVQVANGCGYTITRTWTFTDACNNTSSVSQIINVLDNTAPVAPAAPAPQSFQCLADVTAAGTLTATDNCSGNITATGVDVQVANGCGYTITRTWTFTDACNNTSSVSQTITVLDNIPPVVTCPPAQVFCAINSNTYTIPPATATDNCSGAINITYQITGATTRSGAGNNASGVFNVGISTITWTATDGCGNTSTCTTTVTINAKPAPIIYHN